jgi:hypothetical protein
MDEYLQRLAAQDPELARALADQDKRLADPVEQWREQFKERDQGEEARIRAVVKPLINQVLEQIVVPLIAKSEADLRREFRSLVRRARLRRWSRQEIDRYIASKPLPRPEGT